MKRVEEVTVYTCDAPDCNATRVQFKDDDLPEGFYGVAQSVSSLGLISNRVEWFACKLAHVKEAIAFVIDEYGD